MLYRHFASKQALFAAAWSTSQGLMRGQLERALAADPADPIGGMARAAARTRDDPELPDLLRLRSIAVTVVDEPEIRATLDELHWASGGC